MDSVEIPNWLKELPLAPEFRPTDTEFADPIAYISKIEKEAGAYGVCKIIPPLPKPSKKYVFSNLNKSLSKSVDLGGDCSSRSGSRDCSDEGSVRAVFTTRHQELGQGVKRSKGAVQSPLLGVRKQVWQSGEIYTLEQFESKSKTFARSHLSALKDVTALAVEAIFWKASSEKAVYVEYANDVPGTAFGEPDGEFRHFHRRRRKRNSYRRSRERSEFKRIEVVNERDANSDNIRDISTSDISNTYLETAKPSTSSILTPDGSSHSSRQKSSSVGDDMEGTAGWKLSNSPWNLQIIARSPGSLTRFMPDDIPGVTSPMVYIGMLFSWFAWHVEDHELHSMNFLHTGAPKTWYGIPGDYAFSFEEVVRTEAYGGSVDHFDALSLLGEKTTLMSPEVVVAAGIPCCRLVQNPGEFVVTFPRAYHVGFSHGFNCGEAANFGTPQWLKVAKEAAVRRAAMNYLPMLSHQQLLYLLTMSFVSRIPRSLLPGVRSSRLRDRQREERELLVKRGFVEDILSENNVLSVLLQAQSSCRAVLWNPDLLPFTNKDPQSASPSAPVSATERERVSHAHSENFAYNENKEIVQRSLYEEMSLYMETVDDSHLDIDDLSCDFQVDSGTLACVACGILGFPFMSVLQPSEEASKKLLAADLHLSEDVARGSGAKSAHSSVDLCSLPQDNSPTIADAYPPSKNLPDFLTTKLDTVWNTSNKFLRPRSFCLEHAVEILELLQSKGGANVLVICHSDYLKIKAHAVAIAEEIGSAFGYNEVPLDTASEDDLKLIDLAIEDERDECGEDWTSKLGINLRYCVKVRKNSPSVQVQHALTLGALSSNNSHGLDLSTIKWQSRKSRSRKRNHPAVSKPCGGVPMGEDKTLVENSHHIVRKEEKLIQYSRRNKVKSRSSVTGSRHVQLGSGEGQEERGKMASETTVCSTSNLGRDTAKPFFSASTGLSQVQHDAVLQGGGDSNMDSTQVQVPDLLTSSVLGGRTVAQQIEHLTFKDTRSDHDCCSSAGDIAKTKPMARAAELAKEDSAVCCSGEFHAAEGQSGVVADRDVVKNDSNLAEPASLGTGDCLVGSHNAGTKNQAGEQSCINSIVSGEDSDDKVLQEANRIEDNASVVCRLMPLDHSKGRRENENFSTCASLGDGIEQEIKCTNGSNEEKPISVSVRPGDPLEGTAGHSREHSSASNLCSGETSENEVQQGIQIADGGSTMTQAEVDRPGCFGEKQHPEALGRNSVEDDLVNAFSSSSKDQKETPMRDEKEKTPASGVDIRAESDGTSLENEKQRSDRTLNDEVEENKVKSTYDSQKGSAKNLARAAVVSDGGTGASSDCSVAKAKLKSKEQRKRKREAPQVQGNKLSPCGFARSPCEGLRSRTGRDSTRSVTDVDDEIREKPEAKRVRKPSGTKVAVRDKKEIMKELHRCNLEGCRMTFKTKAQLALHKRNQCPHEGCGKRFSSHKYAMLHQRVHDDERPLKCPWKGCSMSFKWAWARTEHIRVHTGERPYKCQVTGCGLSFRFVSDFSRHRRKTGHYVEQPV